MISFSEYYYQQNIDEGVIDFMKTISNKIKNKMTNVFSKCKKTFNNFLKYKKFIKAYKDEFKKLDTNAKIKEIKNFLNNRSTILSKINEGVITESVDLKKIVSVIILICVILPSLLGFCNSVIQLNKNSKTIEQIEQMQNNILDDVLAMINCANSNMKSGNTDADKNNLQNIYDECASRCSGYLEQLDKLTDQMPQFQNNNIFAIEMNSLAELVWNASFLP